MHLSNILVPDCRVRDSCAGSALRIGRFPEHCTLQDFHRPSAVANRAVVGHLEKGGHLGLVNYLDRNQV